MDFGKEFRDAWTLLKSHPATMVPQAISILLFAAWLFAIVYSTGALPLAQDYIAAQHEFEAQNPAPGAFDLAAAQDYQSARDAFVGEYLDANTERIENLFSLENLKRILILTAVSTLLTFYTTTAAYAAVGLVSTGEKFTLNSTLRLTNKLFMRHVGVRLLQLGLLFIPVAVFTILIIGLYMISAILGFIIAIVGILAAIAYLIYLATRLAFCEPVLFMKRLPAVDCVGESFSTTRKRFGNALVVLVIISLLSWLAGGISYGPLVEMFVALSLSYALAKLIAISIIFIFLLVVHAAVFTLRDLFLFMAYREFDNHG